MQRRAWILLSFLGTVALIGIIIPVVLLVPGGEEDPDRVESPDTESPDAGSPDTESPEIQETEEEGGREYMVQLDSLMSIVMNMKITAQWNYESNITDYNEQQNTLTLLEIAAREKEYWEQTMSYNWQEFEDEDLNRQFQKYSILGTSALPEDQNERLIQAITNMKSTYATSTICDYNNTRCDLYVQPDVVTIFATSEDPDELRHAWVEWHNAAGAPSKNEFIEYVTLSNEAARLNGFDSTAEWWISEYEDETAEEQFRNMWSQIEPLYQQLHAYVRRHLRLKYGENVVSERGPIPAHLLGNIWAQSWSNIESFSKPFPEKPDVDVTAALVQQNYTALMMFQKADEFFQSLTMAPMPDIFWERSIIERPDDGRDLVCQASAWDFYDGEDFRIRQCTTITTQDFKTTHHEMGHIQYKDQPVVYREGANPGFHEAVGDVVALSVATPKHLRLMGLLEDGPDDLESDINQLYKMILDKVVVLPWTYLLDLFRYSVFRGTTSVEDYNCHFWQLRESLQGVEPPVTRTEEDFDPAAKYHICADVEYMRYYVSYIIQFQFHRGLCLLAGEYAPGNPDQMLHNCDIYNSTAAGAAFADMLKMGSSKPWPDAMEMLTGERIMDASGVLDYFQPLYDWLRGENERTGEYIGWEPSNVQYCTPEQRSRMESSGNKKRLRDITGR